MQFYLFKGTSVGAKNNGNNGNNLLPCKIVLDAIIKPHKQLTKLFQLNKKNGTHLFLFVSNTNREIIHRGFFVKCLSDVIGRTTYKNVNIC